ncbi:MULTISPECIES: hypothetical protein [unclassified Streptomyces]|uniref:hypothetical protein n=1 Tax=unclassified Streptomyces TaxID=2593676 RepID=UPI002DDB8308|nr:MULTISPECIES: hypothetical protein [unclassified Streptomyces]WSF81777.1 hypothetical protein OIE70_00295 [Streptomyces sp. NBC_01744]WSC34144.1 hypothetical protein OHA08_00285 [Streptomyces sp. NBC_01763]WSC41914.1 hypothetical protein OHA08_44695 [Streptomyces sp. NBC_01763]WSC50942.1 hypothetical protein OG808_00285 [Streptomyces sp. NBC_01761]WSC58579.1 hypothetical protein OG808_44030 [Streptomyces sp. NBC_01761]
MRSFYDFHRDAGTGSVLNPFPLAPKRVPRSVPDTELNEIFARHPSHQDRALVAFYISTGARASELLTAWEGGVGRRG